MVAVRLIVLALAAACALAVTGPDLTAFTPADMVKLAAAPPNNMASKGGFNDKRMVAQWPALAGLGISQTFFRLEPCALRPPHVHMYASGMLYVIAGANLSVGFTLEDGTPFNNMIAAGASTVFPQGLVHFQQNLGCEEAVYTISYGSEAPGTQLVMPGLLGLPQSVVTATLGMTNLAAINASAPMGTFIPNSDVACVARCAAPATNTAGK